MTALTPQHVTPPQPRGALTARQKQALALAATGMTDAQIAAQLGSTLGSVACLMRNVYARLGLTHGTANPRVVATLYAVRIGLVRVTA